MLKKVCLSLSGKQWLTLLQTSGLFHSSQIHKTAPVSTADGVKCWSRDVPIEKVGLYIPGGTAPLFSTVLMLAIPARLAGCREIIMCTPPGSDGKINPPDTVCSLPVRCHFSISWLAEPRL